MARHIMPSLSSRGKALTGYDLADHIGRAGSLRISSIKVDVRIADARHVWGRLDYLVTPVSGQGCEWVSADRVILEAA